jgi:Predicted permease.
MTAMLRMYSIISVILICFGLFGISYYSVRQRTKEIAIRKINGAKTYQVVGLLVKPVFLWIAISSIVQSLWPV